MNPPLLEPIHFSHWNSCTARHLLNRAGFGIPHSEVDRLAAMRPAQVVDYFVDYEKQPEEIPAPNFIVAPLSRPEVMKAEAGLSDEEKRKLRMQHTQQERLAVQELKGWWLWRMHTTQRPLQEKLTLFWHGHFATSAQIVGSSWHTYQLNDVFRRNASGNLKRLTIEVGQSPSMLRYLDNAQSTKQHPNENWARELMELFTMGKGTYTEDDIKNSARAFTGWSADYRRFLYRENFHDTGDKVFLGRRGDFDGWDILDMIFTQPATAQFVAKKMWKFFAYDEPEPEVAEGLAQTLRSNNYELKPMLRRMFLSKAFYSDKAIGQQVKSPVQFVVRAVSDLEYDEPPYIGMALATQRLGQDLFFPPNVKGWDGNRAWINANTLMIRYNLPTFLVTYQARPDDYAMAAYLGQAGLQSEPPAQAESMNQKMTPNMAAAPDTPAPIPRWDPQMFFASLEFTTAGECVDKMAARLLNVPLKAEQRDVLIQALGATGADAPLSLTPATQRYLHAALHLMVSMAEYQLC